MKLWLTGGVVRDRMLGLVASTKDFDFAVEAESYEAMMEGLHAKSFRAWQSRPEFVTTRGTIRRDRIGTFGGLVPLPILGARTRIDADFTLCRAERMYMDKRHPDEVTPTDITGDLARRDFTINAIAMSEDGEIVDPFGGRYHAGMRELRTVGNSYERFEEDPLRILRGIRFAVTRELYIVGEVRAAMATCAPLLASLPVERVREELQRAMTHNWRATMLLLMVDMPLLGHTLYEEFPRLWFKPSVEER